MIITGTETTHAPTTQVYKATHDGVGNRLPYRYRSFISFSYGGKIIEDFGLIATTGDRLNRNIYADFNDITENHDTLEGQIYWGTSFKNNSLDLTLSTDGITARQLDDFKQWFAPGEAKELILMEHPNRAIMARVSDPPQISMLPFSTIGTTKILNKTYTTEVTLFKGDISLSFVMDEPFWYAKYNIIHPFIIRGGANGIINLQDDPERIKVFLEEEFKKKNRKLYVECIENNITIYRSVTVVDLDIKEMGYWELKAIFDDGTEHRLAYPAQNKKYDEEEDSKTIPIITAMYGGVFTIPTETLNTKIDEDARKDYVKIIYEDNIPHLQMIKDNILLGENIGAVVENDVESRVFNNQNTIINKMIPQTGAHVEQYGYVAYDVASWAENIEISDENSQYLFYSGTAPSKPTLQFTFSPTFDDNDYVNLPRNSYSDSTITNTRDYNYISFDKHKFCFTTPSLITGYNQAINIVKNYEKDQSFEDLIVLLKEKINEYYARAWAIYCVKILKENNTKVPEGFASDFISHMKFLICTDGINPNPITCFFDSKHGTATVTYSAIRRADGVKNYNSYDLLKYDEVQNAGDMVKSDYLIIEGRNYPSFNGYITKEECHIIQTDFTSSHPLTGLLVTFQNMYY